MAKKREAFEDLYRAHEALVRAVIFQIAGPEPLKDLTQEAFVKIWQGLKNFRGDSQVKSWVYRVATNVALDHLRRRSLRKEDGALDLGQLASPLASAEAEVSHRQLVEAGLRALSPEQRAVVVLALIHERELGEIAEILGIPEGTVKSRLHYGKEHFRRMLEEEGELEWAEA